ncbi:SDR family oxidoreductase [Candidatus Kaiserbacteria bacterium]|nr:SDR family oxidoreductase [Candidatus Kaiserbacteria bacterium]
MKKAVVTGGAGFIGSHLSRRLVRDGWKVTVVDDLSTGEKKNITDILKKITFLKFDVNDTKKLTKAMKGADVVFHLAAIPSVPRSIENPAESHKANIDGTFSVLIAARDAKVQRVVYSASSSAYGDTPTLPKVEEMPPNPVSPYGLQKWVGEKYTEFFDKYFGVEGVSLRYFNIYGPHQNPDSPYSAVIPLFIKLIQQGKSPKINGDGSITRDFTFVDDAVEANILAATVPEARGHMFNVARGEQVSLNELVKTISKVLGTNIKPIYGPERLGDIAHSLADISKANTILGYDPRISLEAGIRRTVESMTKPTKKRGGRI